MRIEKALAKAPYIWGLVLINIYPLAVLAQEEAAKPKASAGGYLFSVLIVLLLAVIATLVTARFLYKKRVEEKEKSLSRFLLNDPATRDFVLKQKTSQAPKNHPENE